MKYPIKNILLLLYIAATLAFILWAFLARSASSAFINWPSITNAAPQLDVFTLDPAVREQRELVLDYPASIHAGDSGEVSLVFRINPDEKLLSGAGLPNLYDTHDVMAEARLEFPSVDIRPGASISQPLLPGKDVTFYWSVLPVSEGTYKGTLWFYLRFIPKDGGKEQQVLISSQQLEVRANTFMGIQAGILRGVGLLGFATCLVLLVLMYLGWLGRNQPA